jgi:RNA polymerase sigma-70 factor, ECF subfamily
MAPGLAPLRSAGYKWQRWSVPRTNDEVQRSWLVARLDSVGDDAALVALARGGDAAAFEALVRRYMRPAYAIALGVVKEPADAEDVCQDAFIRALERIDDCEPARFGAWLLRIVRNRAHSVRRYLGVRDASALDTVSAASRAPGPQRDTERAQLRDDLTAALAELSEVQRQVVLLHDLEGWKHREIGGLLDLPEGTVRAHLFHARRALRDHEALRRSMEG